MEHCNLIEPPIEVFAAAQRSACNAWGQASGKAAAASGESASPANDSEPSAMIMIVASTEACDPDRNLPNEAKKFIVVNADAIAIVNSGVTAEGCCVKSGDGSGS